jgi:succinate dehydrogenase / fumarate reductase cytochrome b subunit
MTRDAHFWLRRLHSLSGIVPIGGFLAFHLYENYQATRGAEAYNAAARQLQELPFALALEIGVIAVPIFFHGIYGLFITAESRPNPIANPYPRNGLIRPADLQAWWSSRSSSSTSDHTDGAARRPRSARNFPPGPVDNRKPWLYAYTPASLSATFTSNGLWSFAIVWGITVGPKAQQRGRRLGCRFCDPSHIGIKSDTARL